MFYNSDLGCSTLMDLISDTLLLVFLAIMKGIVLRPIIQVIIAKPMLKTWYNRVKIFYMIVFILAKVRHQIIINFFGIEKEVWNLFSKLGCHLNLYNTCSFCFKEYFSLSSFEEANLRYLQPEVYFLIQARDKLIEFFHFWAINTKHRTRLLEKLSAFFFNFIILKANFTQAVFTL